jgi:hypothetical protein
MLETVATYNPDASHATWNFLRMINPGWSFKVTQAGDTTQSDPDGLAMLMERAGDDQAEFGRDYGGGLSALIDVLAFTLLTQGAIAGELELAQDLKDVLDWPPVNPRLITFKRDEEEHFVPTVWITGMEKELPEAQFRYIPLDPTISDPYGRGPYLPLFESIFFQVEVLRDLKSVAHTQGHPRLHFTVMEEIARSNVPAYLAQPGEEETMRTWLDNYLSDLANVYNAFFTWDWISVDGVSAGQGSFDAQALVAVVEQQVISSLKQLPVLLGRMEGSGLAHGTVQWQMYAQTVSALRRKVATLIGWWATQTLRIWGRPSVARLEFPSIRTQDRLREAQAERLELMNAVTMYVMGWESNDTLAQKFTGHEAVSDPLAIPLSVESFEEAGVFEEGAADGSSPAEARNYGIPKSPESFEQLPVWMRGRISRTRDSLQAQTTVRRERVFQDLMAGSDNGRQE